MRAKTGWSGNKGKDIGWFVGYIEIESNVYFFATTVEPSGKTDMSKFGQIRIDLTKDDLRYLKIID